MQNETVKIVSWDVNAFYRFSIHSRIGQKHDPRIGQPLDWIRKSMYPLSPKLKKKWIYLTSNMNKSLCERFLGEIMPWSTFNIHKKPSPKICFETKNFEILSLSGPRLRVSPITSWAWNGYRAQILWILGFLQVYLDSIRGYEQNLEIVSKMEKLGFSANFAQNLVFAEFQ